MEGDPDHRPTPPEMEEWTKPNINEAQRKEDWIACGGTVHYIQREKESDAAQACMRKKGYKCIGSCRGELSRRLACKGKSIFNL